MEKISLKFDMSVMFSVCDIYEIFIYKDGSDRSVLFGHANNGYVNNRPSYSFQTISELFWTGEVWAIHGVTHVYTQIRGTSNSFPPSGEEWTRQRIGESTSDIVRVDFECIDASGESSNLIDF